MNIDAYLERIAYRGARTPTAQTLGALHRAHMLSVPFENLTIAAGQPLDTSPSGLFEKIVTRRRGGFCYELNGLFARLLRALGYEVTLLSARVKGADGQFGPEFDHMILLVVPPGTPERWLADVGFGDSFIDPLRLDDPGEQPQASGAYRLECTGAEWQLLERLADGAWDVQHRFTLQPRDFADYAAMCAYHQTSPDSPFTRGPTCSRATPEGRVTLRRDRLIVTAHGTRHERPVNGDDEYRALLQEHFGIDA